MIRPTPVQGAFQPTTSFFGGQGRGPLSCRNFCKPFPGILGEVSSRRRTRTHSALNPFLKTKNEVGTGNQPCCLIIGSSQRTECLGMTYRSVVYFLNRCERTQRLARKCYRCCPPHTWLRTHGLESSHGNLSPSETALGKSGQVTIFENPASYRRLAYIVDY